MNNYRDELVSEIKSIAISDNITDHEAFFQLFGGKLEEAEIIEDFHYLYFSGKGSRNKTVKLDGYAYNELDQKLTLFIIPTLSYYEERSLTKTESELYFNRAKAFFFDADKIISNAEESSEGFGLAFDILNKKITVSLLEIIILTDYIKSPSIDIISSTVENNIRVDYSIYDISRMQLMDEAVNGKEAVIINLKEDFGSEGIPVLPASKTDDYQAYLCNISGALLAKMYDKFQSRLLEGNVRSFLQTKGKVNKGIRNTILNNPQMFFAYNNGIAATAESIKIIQTDEGLKITEFSSLQIVNGGQTTASLANAWINDTKMNSRKKIEEIFVPMKISVVSPEAMESLIPDIAKYANSQNKVSDADLASNHKFHQIIESFSRTVMAPAVGGAQYGTYWYYERANGQYRQETYKAAKSTKKRFEAQNPKNQMFKKVDLAKYYNIYLQKPHFASAGSQKSFNKFTEWMLVQWDRNQNFVNEDYYRKVISLCILFKKSDQIVRTQIWYNSYKANIVAYTLSAIFHKIEKSYPDSTLDFQKIWKNQNISVGWNKQIQKVSYIMYQHLTREDRTVENVTEWAKRETSWKMARDINFDFEKEFLEELINKRYVKTQEDSAVKEQKQISEMNALLQVFEYGVDFWKEVFTWGSKEGIWNVQDKSFLKIATGIETGQIPSDKQAVKILQILEKARIESFPK